MLKTMNQYEFLKTPCQISLVFKMLEAHLRNKRVLDIGCATGDYLSCFSRESLGLDYSIPNIEICKAKGLNVIRTDFNEGLPLADQIFDVAFCAHVLEHVDSPIAFLRKIHQVLKENGLLILALPIEKSFVRVMLNDHYFKKHQSHLYSFSRDCIERLLESAGFYQEQILIDMPLLKRFNYSTLLKIVQYLPKKIGFWLSGNYWIIAKKYSEYNKSN